MSKILLRQSLSHNTPANGAMLVHNVTEGMWGWGVTSTTATNLHDARWGRANTNLHQQHFKDLKPSVVVIHLFKRTCPLLVTSVTNETAKTPP